VAAWNVLHVVHRYHPFRGGSELYFQSLSERLAADGANVAVVTTDAWDLEYFWDPRRRRIDSPGEVHAGVRIHRVPVRHLPLPRLVHQGARRMMTELSRVRFPGQVALLERLGQLSPWLPGLDSTLAVAETNPDVAHVGNVAFEGLIGATIRYARRRDVPVIVTPNIHLGEGEASPVRRHYTMPHQIEMLRQVDMITTNTRVERDFLLGRGFSPDKVRVMGVGLRRDEVTGGDGSRIRSRLGIDGPMVLALGVAAFDKGTVHVAQAIAHLNARRREPVSLIVAGPVFGAFSAMIDEMPKRGRRHIYVLGFVSDDDRRDLLDACDILAMPSRTDAFGYVFLEAWSNHKPVIGARAGGIPAVIDDGVSGILVEFGDVHAIGRAIETLVDDRAIAERMGRRGAASILDDEEWYRQFVDVYERLIGRPLAARLVPRTG
jgi:glycogen synthase